MPARRRPDVRRPGHCAGALERSRRLQLERKGEFLRCPWHGWEFDIRTGQSWCDPADLKVRQFKVAVEPGEELVKGPYLAETFAIMVEQDYVVVDI